MNDNITFEQALTRLEVIVRDLESGDIDLEKSIELFEEGIKLSGVCSSFLKEAKQKVEILIDSNSGVFTKEPFSANE